MIRRTIAPATASPVAVWDCTTGLIRGDQEYVHLALIVLETGETLWGQLVPAGTGNRWEAADVAAQYRQEGWTVEKLEEHTTRGTQPPAEEETMGAPLTPEQTHAVATFAHDHGRTWKYVLRAQWMRASASPILHALRNSHGPTWLTTYRPQRRKAGA